MDEVANYWKYVAVTSAQQHEAIIAAQRDDIQALQRRCQEMQYECTMMRASNAMDFRDYCLATATNGQVPLHGVLQFLSNTSDGLVPPPDNNKKRAREQRAPVGVPASPMTRAVQRLMFLNRKPVREGDDEDFDDKNSYAPAPPSASCFVAS